MWDEMRRIRYIHDRINQHQNAQVLYDMEGSFTLCSDEERWKRDDAWAVKKKGLKRAMRVFDNQEEAEVYAYDWERVNDGKIAVVEHRAGEYVRCNGDYCGVAEFCSQHKGN